MSAAPKKRAPFTVGKSSAAEAQRERIVKALTVSPKTSHDLRCIGIYQVSARIKELRQRFGFNIKTELVTLWDTHGYQHDRCALYSLVVTP